MINEKCGYILFIGFEIIIDLKIIFEIAPPAFRTSDFIAMLTLRQLGRLYLNKIKLYMCL